MEPQLKLFPIIIDDSPHENIQFRYEITSYGADYPVDSLVKRLKSRAIFVPPFQRRYVWDIYEASKFVESLILGLPVPGIFLSKESESNNLLIVDGQQRLLTLLYFYTNDFRGDEFRLTSVQKDLEGKRYVDLAISDQTRLDDAIIHSTIVKQDEPDNDNSSIYQIFERINSGGRPLSPQEIRACIYHGEYNKLLTTLAKSSPWRKIIQGEYNDRMKEEELILRFFSLYFNLDKYSKPMKDFLNKCMAENRNFELISEQTLTDLFNKVMSFVSATLGNKAFRYQRGIHSALFDSVSVALAKRLDQGNITDILTFVQTYDELVKNTDLIKFLNTGTSDEGAVMSRIKIATEAFSKVS